jgi:hypothetical protein
MRAALPDLRGPERFHYRSGILGARAEEIGPDQKNTEERPGTRLCKPVYGARLDSLDTKYHSAACYYFSVCRRGSQSGGLVANPCPLR